ncbi:MAG TPA: tRNA lysidine(34) synthetase TilS [Baekduia sp.]|uniref:tRNA lysidine(34) synthetase TilS n=1 Tax=Baekduia sp. TaxID=2600305 RepID=UPI002C7ABE6A|nr:tRNA lysidine(34) synthetase TilS [Baekduia sp.]HMJ35777.1 tRNA lysidine(34) synthetase TilS [Baekduia sp.]
MDVAQRVGATGLVRPGGPLVVLLSGGRDSTCLLDVAVTLAGAEAVRALHVNYGLRGEASDGDERHCAALCERLGVPLELERAQPPEGGNVQAWARDLRYAAGARVAGEHGARLAAGHTLTDQVETILYRLAVSPGRRALLGMEADRGTLVRPLLAAELTRAETAAWCLERGLAWREDATNLDAAFARTRVREGLLPALRAVDERAEVNVLRTAQLLRDEAAVLDEVVATALAGRDRLALTKLASLPPALARLVLRRLAEDATGRLCARAATRLDDVLALGGAGALDLGDGARAIVERGVLRVGRTPARAPKR